MILAVILTLFLLLTPRTLDDIPAQLDTRLNVELTKSEIEKIILDAAARHEINANRFLITAKCESSLRPRVIGDNGNSLGLFQIHLPSHPTVTREQAFNPVWASEWSAIKFRKNPYIWVCYKKLYGQENSQ